MMKKLKTNKSWEEEREIYLKNVLEIAGKNENNRRVQEIKQTLKSNS